MQTCSIGLSHFLPLTSSFPMRTLQRSLPTGAVLALLAAFALALTGCDSTGPNGEDMDDTSGPSIADLLSSRDDLSTLNTAVGAADLADTFADDNDSDDDSDEDGDSDDEDRYTVFAPNNTAFSPLTVQDLVQNRTSLLASILQYHVVENEVLSSDLQDGQTVETL